MRIESSKEKYEILAQVFHGSINDSYVCKTGSGRKCILNVITDRNRIKELVASLYVDTGKNNSAELFTYGDWLCVELPYYESRNIMKFYDSVIRSIQDYERVVTGVVMECLTCELPFPLLYLVLCQQKLNLYRSLEVRFDYAVDFSEFHPAMGEEECRRVCEALLLRLYNQSSEKTSAVYEVLSKKSRRNCNGSFLELYSDIQNASVSIERKKWREKVLGFVMRHGNTIFNVFKWVVVILAVIVLIMLACQIFLGDIPFIRVFTNTFTEIGKRRLDK